ncbi:MAG: hypothetical protein N0E37_00730, partial [Candidatus Thiodiazotropha taylori]|nr:hypothetical protein [Candidatus Thiodiazotropha taylori]MCW4242942.1 hypothetical protein [Candidatus Thiodiazotropha taylori]
IHHPKSVCAFVKIPYIMNHGLVIPFDSISCLHSYELGRRITQTALLQTDGTAMIPHNDPFTTPGKEF